MAEVIRESPVLVQLAAGESQTFKRMKNLSVAPGTSASAIITVCDNDDVPDETNSFTVPSGISPSFEASGGTVFLDIVVEASGGTVYVAGSQS